MIISGVKVKGSIFFDHSKKDTTARGKARYHSRWEARVGYYGVVFRKRSTSKVILEAFLLELHVLNKGGHLKAISEQCKRINPKKKWTLEKLRACTDMGNNHEPF